MMLAMHYPGGKGKTFQHVINTMPPHRAYIETHLGSGAVMRNKFPAARNVGIDADHGVINMWPRHQMPHVEIVHGRAEDYLTQFTFRGDELVYSDPPYHPLTRKRTRVYRKDYSIEDHERLVSILKSLPCMVILSGYKNSLYSAELKDWNTSTFYSKTHTDVREETLWFNFDPPNALHDARYLGSNFRERQSAKRRLQRLKDKFVSMDPVERAAFSSWLLEAYPMNLYEESR